jgi:salicylate 5-hydroxylase large subunit
MQENIKDPYHPGLLHTWFVTFGLWRADNKSQLLMDERHRHAAMISTRGSRRQGRAGDAGVELQGEHAAHDAALPRHRPRALVGRADRGDDDDVSPA